MGKRAVVGVLLALSVMFGGCSSIPLSTMMKFSTFDESDFLEIDPRQLRARVRLEQGFTLSAEKSKLEIEIDTLKGRINYLFPLQELSAKVVTQEASLFFTPEPVTEYQLKLTGQAVSAFLALQQEIKAKKPGSYSLSVSTSLGERPENAEEVTMSVLLKLSEGDDYFTLVDNATLALGKASE
ncbi:hypothetical protein SG34_005875 [Thalassomonas viridans]|uniref:Lipoprotein n=1 Tax=Thalassomonas viridans TaxID=137584 RepID=A0AAF0C8H7_9GAMM|nr:hypothetical protein [Thalassomonas viridans]WDE06447.1 hypothetical protein SG34_005875 [Thalassomonas viridans]